MKKKEKFSKYDLYKKNFFRKSTTINQKDEKEKIVKLLKQMDNNDSNIKNNKKISFLYKSITKKFVEKIKKHFMFLILTKIIQKFRNFFRRK